MNKKNISIIVAIAENGAIGKDNKLLWHLSDDLKRFKTLTIGNTIVMGKRTFESLPVKPLPNRRSIVITDIPGETFEGCEMAYSIEEAVLKFDDDKENFIIGGGIIYKQFLPIANKLYLSIVKTKPEADTYFPEIDFDEWQLIEKNEIMASEKNQFDHTYIVYVRKK